ncbi:acetyltransferase [Rheinheimera baltica]|uniref:Acetyltransferase n=1 Tax=Rheinheimera baltica TaxID=67576 RepID=A0ABT9HWE5_9GAMM|nr:acetyltransferase [Rheinheimera baltica]MDP5135001.1 acetyltransferase [Rheinheimera baltica]
MKNELAKYGVTEPINRPKVKPVKQLDLDTAEGQRLVHVETQRILLLHQNTFKRLASL